MESSWIIKMEEKAFLQIMNRFLKVCLHFLNSTGDGGGMQVLENTVIGNNSAEGNTTRN